MKQIRHLPASAFNRSFSLPAKAMGAGCRVAKHAIGCQVFEHFFSNGRVYGRGGRIIQIDGLFHRSFRIVVQAGA